MLKLVNGAIIVAASPILQIPYIPIVIFLPKVINYLLAANLSSTMAKKSGMKFILPAIFIRFHNDGEHLGLSK
jgi:hypothetical protein